MRDDTWGAALQAIQATVRIPSNLPTIVRGSWLGTFTPDTIVRALAIPGYSPECLVKAAGLPQQEGGCSSQYLLTAVDILGVKASSLILAINCICELVLDSGPAGRVWTPLFKDMMAEIEIGHHLGFHADAIGTEQGMLVGFARLGGLAALLGSHPAEFSDWYLATQGKSSSKEAIARFGCEPYQVSALLLQHLGFGAEIAMSAAVTLGHLHPAVVEAKPSLDLWNTTYHWLHALKAGERAPRNDIARDSLPDIARFFNEEPIPVHLQALLDAVHQVRTGESSWTWHLPRDSYEETAQAIVYKVKSKPYGSTWSRGLATR